MLRGMRIDPKRVDVSLVLDPIEGRPDGAWVFRYRGEAFLTDKGGGNPEPFVSNGQQLQPIESRARAKAPLIGFDVMSGEDVARELQVNPALLSYMRRSDPTFPAPVVTFRDGPIWSAETIDRWKPTRQTAPGRDWSQPRS
jgi:hypothetical protein